MFMNHQREKQKFGAMKNPKIGDSNDEEESTAVEVVAENEDLLTQILLFLPPKSLLRFKSVSKAWLSLLSTSRFRLLKSKRFRKDVAGLISRRRGSWNEDFDFFPLQGGGNPPFARLDYVAGESGGLDVVQSCNGLLLCQSPDPGFSPGSVAKQTLYVVNPTTREYTSYTTPGDDAGTDLLWQVNLAFDPRKSIHFKLICIYISYTEGFRQYVFRIHIYSSETGLMTTTRHTFKKFILNGVYWNDAINWIDQWNNGMYFNVSEERLGIIPMPPLPHVEGWDEEKSGRWIRYYGETNDHFFLMCTESTPTTQFHVYEMDKGYSGWLLRFCVDLQPVFSYYPEAVNPLRDPSVMVGLHPNRYCCAFEILGVVDKGDDEGLFLVLIIRGKAIRFNLKDKSFSKMCDYATRDEVGLSTKFLPYYSFQFIELLHPF